MCIYVVMPICFMTALCKRDLMTGMSVCHRKFAQQFTAFVIPGALFRISFTSALSVVYVCCLTGHSEHETRACTLNEFSFDVGTMQSHRKSGYALCCQCGQFESGIQLFERLRRKPWRQQVADYRLCCDCRDFSCRLLLFICFARCITSVGNCWQLENGYLHIGCGDGENQTQRIEHFVELRFAL